MLCQIPVKGQLQTGTRNLPCFPPSKRTRTTKTPSKKLFNWDSTLGYLCSFHYLSQEESIKTLSFHQVTAGLGVPPETLHCRDIVIFSARISRILSLIIPFLGWDILGLSGGTRNVEIRQEEIIVSVMIPITVKLTHQMTVCWCSKSTLHRYFPWSSNIIYFILKPDSFSETMKFCRTLLDRFGSFQCLGGEDKSTVSYLEKKYI